MPPSQTEIQGAVAASLPLSARDDLNDLQFVARVYLPIGKFGRRDRLAVVFHDDAARQKFLRDQKFLKRTRQLRLNWFSVGGNKIRVHENKLSNSLCAPNLRRKN